VVIVEFGKMGGSGGVMAISPANLDWVFSNFSQRWPAPMLVAMQR
jgi:hypothetical protein